MKNLKIHLTSIYTAVILTLLWFPISAICRSVISVSNPNATKWLPQLRADLLPEPAERMSYLILLVCVATCGFATMLLKIKQKCADDEKLTEPNLCGSKYSFASVMLVALVIVCFHLLSFPGRYYFLGVCYHHFGIVHYPFVMQDLGVTQINQYGAYFLFLRPWCLLFGTSLLSCQILFSLLLLISFICLLTSVFSWCRGRRIPIICFIFAIFFVWPTTDCVQVYLQYHPIRTLIPMIMLLMWMVALFCSHTRLKSISRMIIAILSGVAPIWNIDTGVIVLVSSLIFLFATDIASFRMRRMLVEMLLIVSAFVLTYCFAACSFHNYRWMIDQISFQQQFYIDGFFMMPMKNILYSGAALVLFVEAYALIYGSALMGVGWRDPESVKFRKGVYLVSVSVMAFGLFAYYQGRSHQEVLHCVSWIAVFIFALLIADRDDAMQNTVGNSSIYGDQRLRMRLKACNIGTIAIMAMFILCSLIHHARGVRWFFIKMEPVFPVEDVAAHLGDFARECGRNECLVIADKWQSSILRAVDLKPCSGQRCQTEVFLIDQEREIVDTILNLQTNACVIFVEKTLNYYTNRYPLLKSFLSRCREIRRGQLILYLP